jgi:hypothetical protein
MTRGSLDTDYVHPIPGGGFNLRAVLVGLVCVAQEELRQGFL